MPPILIKTKDNVTLVGAGPVSGSLLDLSLTRAPCLVAADGGAEVTRGTKHRPLAIIGDIDSLTNDKYWQNSDIQIHEIPDQDTTDFEKCLSAIDAPLILGIGFTGGRLDHQVAVLSALWRFATTPVIILSDTDVCFLCPDELYISLPADERISFYPMRQVSGVSCSGLAWPVTGLTLQPDGLLGTSNRTTGDVSVRFDHTGVLVILPLEHLDAAIAALNKTGR